MYRYISKGTTFYSEKEYTRILRSDYFIFLPSPPQKKNGASKLQATGHVPLPLHPSFVTADAMPSGGKKQRRSIVSWQRAASPTLPVSCVKFLVKIRNERRPALCLETDTGRTR